MKAITRATFDHIKSLDWFAAIGQSEVVTSQMPQVTPKFVPVEKVEHLVQRLTPFARLVDFGWLLSNSSSSAWRLLSDRLGREAPAAMLDPEATIPEYNQRIRIGDELQRRHHPNTIEQWWDPHGMDEWYGFENRVLYPKLEAIFGRCARIVAGDIGMGCCAIIREAESFDELGLETAKHLLLPWYEAGHIPLALKGPMKPFQKWTDNNRWQDFPKCELLIV
jgi:hypothetical protein